MTRDMAHEIADRPVTIVSVWPGMVATELAQAIYKKQPEATEAYLRMSSERARKASAQMQPDQSLPDANAGVPEITSPGGDAWAMTESVRFTGRAVVALASDPNVRSKTGRPFSVVGLADEYGFTDVDGRTPDPFHFRDVKIWAPLLG
jgi:NAD(P)-dependent dehydrogenase (short-subunit alcohol dehydrogenase family)